MSTEEIAKSHGWEKIESRDPYMESFVKVLNGDQARVNVWNSRRGTTVGTAINHPKQGRTQLFRRWVTPAQLDKIFKNPRWHSNKGYK